MRSWLFLLLLVAFSAVLAVLAVGTGRLTLALVSRDYSSPDHPAPRHYQHHELVLGLGYRPAPSDVPLCGDTPALGFSAPKPVALSGRAAVEHAPSIYQGLVFGLPGTHTALNVPEGPDVCGSLVVNERPRWMLVIPFF